jgi:hypothetical protein
MVVGIVGYETTATACWALLFIVRAFSNDPITVAVWTCFHVCLMGTLSPLAITDIRAGRIQWSGIPASSPFFKPSLATGSDPIECLLLGRTFKDFLSICAFKRRPNGPHLGMRSFSDQQSWVGGARRSAV